MNKIEYNISLNKSGRPSIELPIDYENNPEDKFLAIEITRYIFHDLYGRMENFMDEETISQLNNAIQFLQQISDEMALIIFDSMKVAGDASFFVKTPYHIQVKTIDERNALDKEQIFYDGKIFTRQIGLKVLVTDEMKLYELKDGINNENWTEISE